MSARHSFQSKRAPQASYSLPWWVEEVCFRGLRPLFELRDVSQPTQCALNRKEGTRKDVSLSAPLMVFSE